MRKKSIFFLLQAVFLCFIVHTSFASVPFEEALQVSLDARLEIEKTSFKTNFEIIESRVVGKVARILYSCTDELSKQSFGQGETLLGLQFSKVGKIWMYAGGKQTSYLRESDMQMMIQWIQATGK